MKKIVMALVLLIPVLVHAQTAGKPFSDLLGPVSVQNVDYNGTLNCPFMSWGADFGFSIASGPAGHSSITTTLPGSSFENLGLKVSLHHQDDFPTQVRDYISGKSPFLRCTFGMLGPASEVLGADPRTKPVIIGFCSWSNGDFLVARAGFTTLNDLKPKNGHKVKIALQQGGAHISFLYEILKTVQLSPSDVDIVWCKNMVSSGHNDSPPELFRTDSSVDMSFCVTPDEVSLTSGADKIGSGAEGTVKGAHVLLSTQQMTHAIPDIIACRSDFYAAHKDIVTKFIAGYVAGSEKLVAMRNDFDKTHRLTPEYKDALQSMQNACGKDMLPDLENDCHGFLEDCNFGGMEGQVAFFQDKLSGYDAQMTSCLDMANAFGFIHSRRGFDPSSLDYQEVAKLAGVPYVVPNLNREKIKAEATSIMSDSELDSNTLYQFTIYFEPNQEDFSIDRYGADFERALKAASQFGGCVVAIRGNADPTQTIVALVRAGMSKGILKKVGSPGNFTYYLDGHPLDLSQTAQLVALIKGGSFDGTDPSPKDTMQAALNLNLQRAVSVKNAILQLAKQENVSVDMSQIQPSGAGISDPVIPKPHNIIEAKQNMRVDFKIVRVSPESIKQSDFNY